MDRRDFLKLAGIGGVVFASGLGFNALGSNSSGAGKTDDDFYFVQLSDTHWGFQGPPVNPDSQGTLKKAIAAVNSLEVKPDFVVFTGDLTHISEDPKVRHDRMDQFRDIIGGLQVKTVHLMAGEHDASLDRGDAYQQFFGKLHYSFAHKGVQFVVLDNVSDPAGAVGAEQLGWLKSELGRVKKQTPVVVLTHRPLFPLYPQWDWTTKDGQDVIDALMGHPNVTVFYGHIHQENHHQTGHISHHAAKSLMFPLPAPGAAPKRAPIPWDASSPYKGLGFREVTARLKGQDDLKELPIIGS
ncbi:MAG: metallophosphoesterase family protein [Blastocatellia bacterium]